MKQIRLEDLGLKSMSLNETIYTDGGEIITQDPIGYGYNVREGLHVIADFCRGVWDGIVN